jgi:hypothetical protein
VTLTEKKWVKYACCLWFERKLDRCRQSS